MNKIFKLAVIVVIALLSVLLILVILWQSPAQNTKGEFFLHPESINCTRYKTDLELELRSGAGVIFNIKQIKNAPKQAINPYFPVILIQPNVKHDGWIHIVYTDASHVDDLKWKTFIDHDPKATNYPFYSYLQYFYDAPSWNYSILNKPLGFWKGHAFAVKVDHQNKIINCIGGIEWGFKLSLFRSRPKAIYPKLLDEHDWRKAWGLLIEKLPGYQQTYGENL